MSYPLRALNLLRKKNMRPNRVRSSVRAEQADKAYNVYAQELEELLGATVDGVFEEAYGLSTRSPISRGFAGRL